MKISPRSRRAAGVEGVIKATAVECLLSSDDGWGRGYWGKKETLPPAAAPLTQTVSVAFVKTKLTGKVNMEVWREPLLWSILSLSLSDSNTALQECDVRRPTLKRLNQGT